MPMLYLPKIGSPSGPLGILCPFSSVQGFLSQARSDAPTIAVSVHRTGELASVKAASPMGHDAESMGKGLNGASVLLYTTDISSKYVLC